MAALYHPGFDFETFSYAIPMDRLNVRNRNLLAMDKHDKLVKEFRRLGFKTGIRWGLKLIRRKNRSSAGCRD
jgi:hypothetical protein